MFRVFGHEKVWVLDGGLPRWRASGYDVESSASGDAILKASAASEAIEKIYQGQTVSRSFGEWFSIMSFCRFIMRFEPVKMFFSFCHNNFLSHGCTGQSHNL